MSFPCQNFTIMGNFKKELTKMGFTDNVVRSRILEFVKFECKHWNESQIVQLLQDIAEHPENYKNLVVRVAGYSALFTTLSRSLQDDIIRRTEQTSF